MITFLRFFLPISAIGFGTSTALSSSYVAPEKSKVSDNSSITIHSFLEPSREINYLQPVAIVEAGNCYIDESMKSILRSQAQQEKDYYSVTCENVGIGEKTDTTFESKWRGAFPEALFASKDWNISKRLEIKVRTEFSEEETQDANFPHEIKFSSPQFKGTENSQINGIWDYKEDLDEKNNTGVIAKLTYPPASEIIYLFLNAESEE